ncbi:tRNA dihydrouridine(16) synthase DusC [Endozoicomonas sp. (ex Bugula neritina AB1)]|nr:tRNA dihydrouridine(16) synthase DusC [Endozoicomonas sp. (ex Bugula neritina AB1)]
MRLILAPMEGVMDFDMRDLLTAVNSFDLCVTEFIRVSETLLPRPVFRRMCPELLNGGKTSNGTPVRIQLLGCAPELMALNAQRAVELGSPGIDINFGCPSPKVNQKKGGAILLLEPDLVYDIVKSVREAVPEEYPVTAKIRLGYFDKSQYLENAHAVQDAGASELAVHARTRDEGYKPPAHWEYIGRIREALNIPVIANGDIWNHHDAEKCMSVSGCSDLMVGRASLITPDITGMIRERREAMPWASVVELMIQLGERDLANGKWKYHPSRLKQWLNYLRKAYPEAQDLFTRIRSLKSADEIVPVIIAEHKVAA